MLWLFLLALLLLILGGAALNRARRLRRDSGLPFGRLVYADVDDETWRPPESSLYAPAYRLTGKPDYLVATKDGPIPVEVKSAAAPQVPYLGHLLQLAAYCLLVEATTGRAPRHGLLKYDDALYQVDFSQELRRELLETMGAIRQARLDPTVSRSHDQPNKCAACGFRLVCDESLV